MPRAGLSTPAIANGLSIAKVTVRNHVQSILQNSASIRSSRPSSKPAARDRLSPSGPDPPDTGPTLTVFERDSAMRSLDLIASSAGAPNRSRQ